MSAVEIIQMGLGIPLLELHNCVSSADHGVLESHIAYILLLPEEDELFLGQEQVSDDCPVFDYLEIEVVRGQGGPRGDGVI